jgi:pimeloyl-ACP methyl ester carboxylesterase
MARQADEAGVTNTLAVPEARLYYEVSGSGPVLLLIPVGAADADIVAPIVGFLTDNYTVVRYDPRGISRSRLEGPPEDVPVALHADDAQPLLLAIGSEPAFVFGSSGGAVIGLALVGRHPVQVRTLVAHEPPLLELLPEESVRREAGQEIYDTYRKEAAGPAMEQFLSVWGLGQSGPSSEATPEMQDARAQPMARMQQNVDFFLAHYLLPITAYVPNIAALRRSPSHVVVGVGEDSGGQLAHDIALVLAERLGTPAVALPDGHAGYVTHPEAFADKLHAVLQASEPDGC